MARCACGVENPSGAKFCKACGQPIMAAGAPIGGGAQGPAFAGGGMPFAGGVPPTRVEDSTARMANGFGGVPPTRLEGQDGMGARPTEMEGAQNNRGRQTVFEPDGGARHGNKRTILVGEESRNVVGFLVCLRGAGAAPYADFPIFEGKNPIGAEPTNQISLRDDRVSGQHATIIATNGACTLMDLGSANGTVVDSKKVLHVELHHGAMVKVGGTTLVFVPVPGAQGLPG